MPLPRSAARFNRVVTNRVFAPMAGRIPPWVVVEHIGRTSGRTYHTVAWAFPRHGDMMMALTYGPRADWVRNVLAAGHVRLKWAGHWFAYVPELVQGIPALRLLPGPLRPLLGAAGIHYVLHLHCQTDLVLDPVGHVESSLTERDAAPKQGDEGAPGAWLVFDARFSPSLGGLKPGDEALVLTWLDRARRDVRTVHPRGDLNRPVAGVFSTRSPDRPNPIGLHRVTIVDIVGTRVRVSNLEALNGTPILDVKPVLGTINER